MDTENQTSASCGCDCEFCSSGNHAQCQSGTCTMKDKPSETPTQGPPAEPAA